MQAPEKKFTLVFIASLVSELSLQWINPRNHSVRLFIESTKISHTRKDIKVTDVCLRCGED